MSDDPLMVLGRAVGQVLPTITAVSREDLARPTPCPGFDVRAVVAHLIGGLRGFAEVAEGKPLRFDADPDLDREDAGVEFQVASDRMLRAFGGPGMLERDFAMPWGVTTGAQLVGFELIEVLTHGWDTATAIGRPVRVDDAIVDAALTGAREWVDESVRTPQMFGPEIPATPDARPIDRLVAFLGRQPDWSADRSLRA